ncbi:MAG: 4-phosphopantetheinyl transferase superfamily protein [Solirubrobacterales bacterium]|nr:4-phosphopantetheinyl transferase superfamily protein [Solirubrobacterales bacterium]
MWRASLGEVPDALTELLSDHERERERRFARPSDGRLWARGRGVLRELLGRYLQSDPRALEIVTGPNGKPALAAEPTHSEDAPGATGVAPEHRLSFNLSHSGEIGVFAFTTAGPIGVDVEVARGPRDTLALAARALGAEQAARLGRLDPAERQQEFLRAWARQEAILKCLGTGLGGAAAPAERPGAAPSELWTAELDMGAGAAAAVALDAAPRELCCWIWRGARRAA